MNGRGLSAAYRLTICSVFFGTSSAMINSGLLPLWLTQSHTCCKQMCDLISSATSTACIYEHTTLSILFPTMLSSSRIFAYHCVNTFKHITEKMSGDTKQSLPFLHEFPHIPAWQTMQWYKKDNGKNERLMSMILKQQNQWIFPFVCLAGACVLGRPPLWFEQQEVTHVQSWTSVSHDWLQILTAQISWTWSRRRREAEDETLRLGEVFHAHLQFPVLHLTEEKNKPMYHAILQTLEKSASWISFKTVMITKFPGGRAEGWWYGWCLAFISLPVCLLCCRLTLIGSYPC